MPVCGHSRSKKSNKKSCAALFWTVGVVKMRGFQSLSAQISLSKNFHILNTFGISLMHPDFVCVYSLSLFNMHYVFIIDML